MLLKVYLLKNYKTDYSLLIVLLRDQDLIAARLNLFRNYLILLFLRIKKK